MSSLQYLEVVFCFLSLTELTRFSILSFVLWSFQVLGKDLMDYGTKSGKSLSLGMPKAPQGKIQGQPKSLSLGMPRKASPLLSSSIGNFTWSYIFIHHMICVLLGASFYFVIICLMLFIIMFCIYIFNKNVKDSLCHAYFASIHVVVWKQKVNAVAKIPRKVRECYNVESFCILRSDKFTTVGIFSHNFWI